MRWVVEEFTTKGANMVKIEGALRELGIPYTLINIEKELREINKETRIPETKTPLEVKENLKGTNTLVFGSKALRGYIEALEITPGTYVTDEILDYCRIKEQIPGELLNEEYKRGRLENLEPVWEEFFIRPVGNSKIIDGRVITKEEYKKLQKTKQVEEDILIAPLKEIQEEYRFFVVDGKVISGSSYRVRGVYSQ